LYYVDGTSNQWVEVGTGRAGKAVWA
jgi:hypothetical protein